jgi:peptide/nickel transport system permease protein
MSNLGQTNQPPQGVTDAATKNGDATRSARPAKRPRGDNMWRGVLRNRKAQVGGFFLLFFLVLAVFPGLIAPYSPSAESFLPNLSPSAAHWLGTTSFGQDIYSQLIWGARQSLIIAFAAGFIATFVAVIVGVASAYL